MQFYLSIDDTDNHESPGSGQLATVLAKELTQFQLARKCSNISRHQLFVDSAIPYTSHNSSMCFSAETESNKIDDIIGYSKKFLRGESAPGSDPGLCVAVDTPSLHREALSDFGLKAKQLVLTKENAYLVAKQTGVHLSENGGTGDGIIGALAGIGLRLEGNDGRFRGWLHFENGDHLTSPKELCDHPEIDGVVNGSMEFLPENTRIVLAESTLKTVLINHRQVIPVTHTDEADGSSWTTLTRAEIKQF